MVGGITWVYKRGENELTPNAWTWDEQGVTWQDITEYETGEVYEIDATGSAFVLINRRVFEWLAQYSDEWHTSGIHPDTGTYMGHDLAFCYDAVVRGPFKLFWDTGVQSGHIKHFELDEKMYRNFQESQK